MATDNSTLGVFRLDGIPPAPRGIPQIEVTFDIDANGILNVTAQDKATGKSQNITITASTNLSDADVDRMVREAEQNAATDQQRRETIEARNMADQLIYQTQKSLADMENAAPEMKAQVESKIAELKEALNGDDTNRIQQLTADLQQAAMALGQAAYQNGSNGSGEATQSGDDEDIVEGEFEAA
jgi:molecular chaperone DnaK